MLTQFNKHRSKASIFAITIDDALIVSRVKSSQMKPSSLILILVIAKEELSHTGVVPATESPMPKSEGVNQNKLC